MRCHQLDELGAHVVEQTDTVADEDWGDVYLQLVEQSQLNELLNDVWTCRRRAQEAGASSRDRRRSGGDVLRP